MTWRGRSSRSRGRASTRAASAVRTSSRSCSTAASRTAPSKTGPTRPPSPRSRCGPRKRPAASKRRWNGCAACRTTTAAGATRPARRATPTPPAPCWRRWRAAPRPPGAASNISSAPRSRAAASRSAATARSTPSRRPGRSRASSPPAATWPPSAAAAPARPNILAKHQAGDGHYRYSGSSDQTPVWVTGEVLVAAAERPLPDLTSGPRTQAQDDPNQLHRPRWRPSVHCEPFPRTRISRRLAERLLWRLRWVLSRTISIIRPERSGAQPGKQSSGDCVRERTHRRRLVNRPYSGEPAESTSSEEPEESTDSTSPAGAIAVGLLAGALLFGAAWAGRKVWMRQRYGI